MENLEHRGDAESVEAIRLNRELLEFFNEVRVVLPGGATNLDQAAQNFVTSLTPEYYQKLDDAIQRYPFLRDVPGHPPARLLER